MSKVDDELTRRLRRAERPVDGDDLFEGLERRRSHRERVRKVQAGMLAFAVLAATAGGFVALRSAFDPDTREVGESPSPVALFSNGEIVFVREGPDGRSHVFAAQPDGSGLRQITSTETNDTEPAVSPDGRTIALVHELEDDNPVIATISIEGGSVTARTALGFVTGPTWSPDGSQIAFVLTGTDSSELVAMDLETRETTRLFPTTVDGSSDWADQPSWSPDGNLIAFILRPTGGLVVIQPDGSGFDRLIAFDEMDESAPAWSPDGSRIAFVAPYGTRDGIWAMPASGGEPSLLAAAPHIQHDLAWAPDGSALLVSDGAWIYRVDVNSQGEPRDNFVRLVEGHSPSWQSLPAGSDQTPTPIPEPSTSPDPEGDHLLFGFGVCELSQVTGQFDGVGATDIAYVATEQADGGGCPAVGSALAHVGIDLDEDGVVDATHGPIPCEVYYCRAFAAPDLDDSGTDELLVVESAGSITGLGVYALGDPTSEGTGVVRILIGEPDYVQNGFVTGEPARLFIGGDEGWSYRLRCEDHGVSRFIYQQRAFRPVDSTSPATVDETTLIYWQGRLEFFDARDRERSTSDDPLGPQPAEVCGAPIPAI